MATSQIYWKLKAVQASKELGTKVVPCPPAQCAGMEFTNSKGNIVSICNNHDGRYQVIIDNQWTPLYTGGWQKSHKQWVKLNT